MDEVRAINVRIVERAQFDRREDNGKQGMDLVGVNAGMSGPVSGRKGSQLTVSIVVLVSDTAPLVQDYTSVMAPVVWGIHTHWSSCSSGLGSRVKGTDV